MQILRDVKKCCKINDGGVSSDFIVTIPGILTYFNFKEKTLNW